jgi:TonB family protein
MVFHGGLLGLFALLMPALLFHQESFGPPVRVEQRVEPEQRVLPHWQSRAEMPPVPAMEVVLEPVEEFEAAEEQNLAECDVSFTVLGDLNPANSYPVCAVGQFTRARVAQPVAAAMPMVAMPAPSGPVAMPPAPGGAATVRSGGPSHAARVVGELDPRYPERQRVAGRSATVLLLVRIDESGRPADVQLLNDGVHPDFAKAAVSAARKARYEPALAEGRPVASEIRVRVQFQLQ